METKSKILIVDDEEVVLDSCTRILEGGNYQVATAQDALRGLELVREFGPDLVFVDLKMPGKSGLELLEDVRTVDATIVPIVITGYATVSSAVDAMKKGAYDFLPKPFTPDEFRLITQRGLEKRKLVLETLALRREKEILRRNFAAIVSHELKAPLSAVQQSLYVLTGELAGHVTEDQESRLARMKFRIDGLLKLIQTWLRVISADIGKIKESFRPVSVQLAISNAIENVLPLAARKNIEIVSAVPDRAVCVYGDEGTLGEALVNILSNAIKYSHAGSKVSLAAEATEARVSISVSDQGVGISQEDLPFIFDGFYSGKSAPDAERGCGLGLAIGRRIIEAHNGTISVESELGKGSMFVIHLPRLKGAPQIPLSENAGIREEAPKGGLE